MAVNLSPVGGVAAQFFDNSGNVLTGGKIYTYLAGTTTPATTYTTSAGAIAWSNPIVLDASGRVSGSGEIWLTDSIVYKFVLKDSNDVLIATYDNITGINSNFVNFVSETEIQTATAGQTVFTLTTMEYQPGTNNLLVFVDGVNQYEGSGYSFVETDSTTVTFISGLHVGAEVKFTTATPINTLTTDAATTSYTPPFANSVATNVEDKLAQVVSVKDFGAAGDGTTDDTTAIQNALDSGYTVYVPDGTYIITSQITIPSNTYFYGNGASSIIKRGNNATAPANNSFVINENWASSGYSGDTNITIANLAFDGNKLNNADWCGGVYIRSAKQIYLDNVSAYNWGQTTTNGTGSGLIFSAVDIGEMSNCRAYSNDGDGMLLYSACLNIKLSGHAWLNGGIGFEIEGRVGTDYTNYRNNNVLLSNCISTYNDDHGFLIDWSDDIVMSNCISDYNQHNGAEILGCNRVVIDSCAITNNGAGAAWAAALYVTSESYGSTNASNSYITISNNVFNENNKNILVDTTSHIVIDSNQIKQITTSVEGIYLRSDVTGATYSTITNNMFRLAGTAIRNDGQSYMTVQNNDFYGIQGVLIYTGTSYSGINIFGNRFQTTTGIKFFPSVTLVNSKIQNNLFIGSTDDITADSGSYTVLSSSFIQNNVYAGTGVTYVNSVGALPATGTWRVGDTIYSATPTAGGTIGWVCVTAGSPGTWKTFGAITA